VHRAIRGVKAWKILLEVQRKTEWELLDLVDFSIASPGSLVHSNETCAVGMMTRAGVTYVAMVAAAISAGALGYAVIWSYGEPDASSALMLAPPAQEIASAVVPQPKPEAAATHTPGALEGSSSASADAPSIAPPVASKPEPPREPASAPASPPHTAATMPPRPDQRWEKPKAASTPKDPKAVEVAAVAATPKKAESLPARAIEKPVVAQPSAPLAAPPRPTMAVVPPPALPATSKVESPPEPASPAPEIAAAPITAPTLHDSRSASNVVAVQTPATDTVPVPPPSPERPVIGSRPKQFRAIAPPQREQRSALIDMPLEELAAIGDQEFSEMTKGSAIRRAKPEGMRRNARLAIENAES